jgi:hypothetical protein
VTKALAFAGKPQPRRLNNWPFRTTHEPCTLSLALSLSLAFVCVCVCVFQAKARAPGGPGHNLPRTEGRIAGVAAVLLIARAAGRQRLVQPRPLCAALRAGLSRRRRRRIRGCALAPPPRHLLQHRVHLARLEALLRRRARDVSGTATQST